MKIAFVLLLAILSPVSTVLCADFYVSPLGKDTNSGSSGAPFQTLEAAQMAARKVAGREPVNIFLKRGTYYLPETLVLTSADSGTRAAPVVWQAAPGETPVISGGELLQLNWKPWKNGIFQAQVPAGLDTDQIFVNGERQILARYPNFDPNERIFNGYAADAISPERVQRWSDPAGGYFHAMHPALWGGFSYLITGKDANGNLQYEGGWQGNRAAGPNEKMRMVEGIFEALDAPREWFLNKKTNTLYYYPPAGVDLKSAKVEAVILKHLIEFRGSERQPVRFVTLRGIVFRHTARTFMLTKEPILRSDWTIYRGGAILFNGAEDCSLEGSFLDQLGGNAVFVNNYNRRVTIRGCRIEKGGASGVTFVGDPKAVRSPLFEYGQTQSYASVDLTPGPLSDNYPADCLVDDCLITLIGRFEKQAAGVGIDMAARITVRHCSIYNVPRAGINIGDGCWGGHVIEYCDIFDTVKETADHGSFNSWGRDRYWRLNGWDPHAHPEVAFLDAVEPIILRNNRWRCDHGWDIDLDDGSSNYEIYNNLCLNGGIKNREGYRRIVVNNIIPTNGFHPHVWFPESQDVFRNNILCDYHAVGMKQPWGKEFDCNIQYFPGNSGTAAAVGLQHESGQDQHSVAGDALFVEPPKGDYRVEDGSPALAIGFKSFPMDQFGVQSPALRALTRTPELPQHPGALAQASYRSARIVRWLGVSLKNVISMGEVSATGLYGEAGVRVVDLPAGSRAAQLGIKENDVILKCNGAATDEMTSWIKQWNSAVKAGRVQLEIWRDQAPMRLEFTLSPGDNSLNL